MSVLYICADCHSRRRANFYLFVSIVTSVGVWVSYILFYAISAFVGALDRKYPLSKELQAIVGVEESNRVEVRLFELV